MAVFPVIPEFSERSHLVVIPANANNVSIYPVYFRIDRA
jgi:hypothetical protein